MDRFGFPGQGQPAVVCAPNCADGGSSWSTGNSSGCGCNFVDFSAGENRNRGDRLEWLAIAAINNKV